MPPGPLQVRHGAIRTRRPSYELVEAADDPVFGHGFELLPAPDDGDVFFDFEGHPFWTRPTRPLLPQRSATTEDRHGDWTLRRAMGSRPRRAGQMIKELVEFFAARRVAYPEHARVSLQPHGAVVARAI